MTLLLCTDRQSMRATDRNSRLYAAAEAASATNEQGRVRRTTAAGGASCPPGGLAIDPGHRTGRHGFRRLAGRPYGRAGPGRARPRRRGIDRRLLGNATANSPADYETVRWLGRGAWIGTAWSLAVTSRWPLAGWGEMGDCRSTFTALSAADDVFWRCQ